MADLDYKTLYEQICAEYDQYQLQTDSQMNDYMKMIDQIQKQKNQLKGKNQLLQIQIDQLKDKKKSQTQTLEKQLELIKREKNQFQTKFFDFQRKVVQLENINETLEADNRASKCMLDQYQQRVEKTMEQLALLQMQLQENKQSNQQQVTRLKNQLKQTQEELYVLHLKHQKHNDQSQYRRSRLSSSASSFSSSQDDMSRVININNPDFLNDKTETNTMNNILTMDFKRNKDMSFQKTVSLLTSLIGQLDGKSKKIKAKKKVAVC